MAYVLIRIERLGRVMTFLSLVLAIFLILSPPHLFRQVLNLPDLDLTQSRMKEQKLVDAAIYPTNDFNHVLVLSDWAQMNTPKGALFLAPPYAFAERFRAFSLRNIVVSYKDGVSFLLFRRPITAEWFKTYQDVSRIYLTNDTAAFERAAQRYGASYVIVDNTKNALELPVIHVEGPYTVYSAVSS